MVVKDELLNTLWPESFVEESNLAQHIFLLRNALSRHESGTKIIETVPGRGYRFAATITEQPPADRMVVSANESITRIILEKEEEDASRSAFLEREVIQAQPLLPSGLRRLCWTAGGSVAVVALCVASWFGWQRWHDSRQFSRCCGADLPACPLRIWLKPEASSSNATEQAALLL